MERTHEKRIEKIRHKILLNPGEMKKEKRELKERELNYCN